MSGISLEFEGKHYTLKNTICGLGVIFIWPSPVMMVAGVCGGLVVLDNHIIGEVFTRDEDYSLRIDDGYEQDLAERVDLICRTAGVEADEEGKFAFWYYLVNREGMKM